MFERLEKSVERNILSNSYIRSKCTFDPYNYVNGFLSIYKILEMSVEARFTIKGMLDEIPFTIVEGEEGKAFLYAKIEDFEYKFPLFNDSGLLKLTVHNPFEESIEIVDERLTGMSADFLELKSQGFESSSGVEMAKLPGYGPDDIFVENKPFSLKQIVDLIEFGDIELTPNFQRNFIWDKTRQSRLIESILLGLPLPSIYLSQYEDGRLTIVDGLQRLSTIRAFFKDELTLSNLEYLEEGNGKKYSQLEKVLSPLRVRRFGQTQIMCFVIDYRSPSQLKFDLFRRLNTGGKPLNNQEIRNCLSRPEVQEILLEMVSLNSFGLATGWSVKDARMDAREAALRFICFCEKYTDSTPVGDYNGDMESTLDFFIDDINKRKPEDLMKYISLYDCALSNAYHLFGDYCFRKVLPETLGGRKAPVNKLLMLSFSVLLSKYDYELIKKVYVEDSLLEPLAEFIGSEPDVFPAITYGTNGKWNMEIAFKAFKKFLDMQLKQTK